MSEEKQQLPQTVEALEKEGATLKRGWSGRGVRKRSTTSIGGLPLYDIALGPDLARNEPHGHARGIFAIGDLATGVVALGGIARGVVAIGGLALGAIALGGCSIGVLVGIGGLAIGGVALGGAAVGIVAAGGGAIGYYARGGGAFGKYVISEFERNPEAIRFFGQWLPGIGGGQ